jgi:hypothetical protein
LDFFSCNVNNLPSNFSKLARKSYENYGFFLLKEVLDEEQISQFRSAFDELFSEPGDSRLRFLRQTRVNSIARKKMIKHISLDNLNNALSKTFPENDISWLPPFNVAHNYLPHSIHTRGAGWHRDVSGETRIHECRELLKNKDYFFGKTGLYLQSNSDHGGAIDLIPKTNNDFFGFSYRKYRVIFLIKLLIFSQKYISWIYKLMSRGSFFSRLLGSITLPVNAGDCVIFDARIWHKGTFADVNIEKSLKYKLEQLQAELPYEKTKYVLYSHIGNSIGAKSYFIDRLSREDNKSEADEWFEDASVISQSTIKSPIFFRKKDSILDKSFFPD